MLIRRNIKRFKMIYGEKTLINRFCNVKLKCPICNADMDVLEDKTLFCNGEKKHTYDISSSGYINLASPKQCGGGDTKDAVRARRSFLDRGYYAPIAKKTVELLKKYAGDSAVVIDAGCGEGYYTSRIASSCGLAIGFDISKFAVEAAAKRAKREKIDNLAFCVASVYSMPIFDGFADAVVNIFAPCVEQEYLRVLKSDGIILVVHAGRDHLMGLKRALYSDIRENDERADLPAALELVCEEELKYDITVDGNENIQSLFAMTPYYWRTSVDDAKKLDGIDVLTTEIDIIFSVYRKNSDVTGEKQ